MVRSLEVSIVAAKILTTLSITADPTSGTVPFDVVVSGYLKDDVGNPLGMKEVFLWVKGPSDPEFWAHEVAYTELYEPFAGSYEFSPFTIDEGGTWLLYTEFHGDAIYEGCEEDTEVEGTGLVECYTEKQMDWVRDNCFGVNVGDPDWEKCECYDFNGDGKINILDGAYMATHICPPGTPEPPFYSCIALGIIDVHAFLNDTEVNASVEVVGIGTYTTPFSLELPPRNYTLNATYETYSDSKTVTVVAGEITPVDFTFVLVPEIPWLILIGIICPSAIGLTLSVKGLS